MSIQTRTEGRGSNENARGMMPIGAGNACFPRASSPLESMVNGRRVEIHRRADNGGAMERIVTNKVGMVDRKLGRHRKGLFFRLDPGTGIDPPCPISSSNPRIVISGVSEHDKHHLASWASARDGSCRLSRSLDRKHMILGHSLWSHGNPMTTVLYAYNVGIGLNQHCAGPSVCLLGFC